ncbi:MULTISPECIES: SDR family NAD(P)-dependent oxidoreductase [Agrococcus]|uniref:Short-chain dehydrogenase/reductase n=1 Tax=Agrococcus baldri TaxID=153730 RepID=A0AA87RBE5_9MICO|nr:MULTISPECIES: glucose 1-dehydrogenase [Agrococcus]MCH1881782.1 glucose 1-dehydrogenase [Agrococcus sp. ARC_14]GEK79969.1 short-chain dehydrogenase/reductase [Agrococcus baldri]
MQTDASGRFQGRVALVTGAGRGLGAAIADRLAAGGATVLGTSRSTEEAQRIGDRYGTRPCVLDLTEIASIEPAIQHATDAAGGIDLLVNNAGVNVPVPALQLREDDWDAVHDVNVKGTFFVTQALARHWVSRGAPGAVVTIGSQAGIVAIEDRAAYGSSKAAIAQLTRQLAFEWGQHGIRVNAVAPTFVPTELTASTLSEPVVAERLLARIPLGRFGTADEVADAVAFLLSDAASLITGHTLVADGGYTVH